MPEIRAEVNPKFSLSRKKAFAKGVGWRWRSSLASWLAFRRWNQRRYTFPLPVCKVHTAHKAFQNSSKLEFEGPGIVWFLGRKPQDRTL